MKESDLKEEKIRPIKCKFLTFFFLSAFYLPLFNSVTKKTIPKLKKYWGGGGFVPPCPLPQVMPMVITCAS
jgi:hypothetical protein